jgi:uncharacterized protein (DUF1015 family)
MRRALCVGINYYRSGRCLTGAVNDAENMAKQINLYYTRSFDEALSEVRCGNAQCTFILNPTRVSEISQVATNGEKMPQKSTYFYPKLITGLVMNKLM